LKYTNRPLKSQFLSNQPVYFYPQSEFRDPGKRVYKMGLSAEQLERVRRDFETLAAASKIRHHPERMENLSVEDNAILDRAEWIESRPNRLKRVQNFAREEANKRKQKKRDRALRKLAEIKMEREKTKAESAMSSGTEQNIAVINLKGSPPEVKRPGTNSFEPQPVEKEGPGEGEDLIKSELGASPQAEDGHIDVANEIAEALAKINLSSYESRVLWAVFRKTYGWHKKTDQISITQFQKITGMKRRHVSRTLSKLLQRNIVTQIGDSRITTYGFKKDYTKWKDITQTGDDVGIPRVCWQGMKKIVTQTGDRSSPKQVHTKETNKRKKYVETEIEFQLSLLLFKEMRKKEEELDLSPTQEPNLQKWAVHIDRMIHLDKRDPERIREVIEFSQRDSFWRNNIESTGKLRDKFKALEGKMRSLQKGKEPERPKEKPRILT
jgi:phage replication O-like protein O